MDWSGSCRRHVQQRCSRQVTALNISIIMPKETFRHDQIQRTVLVKSRWCNLMHAVASSSVCHLQLAGSSRQRSRTAQHAQRWQTHRACMLGTRSEQAGCAAPSERRKSEIGSACSSAPGLGLWRQERSASGLPARPGAVGPGGPAPIVLKVISWTYPFEKAGHDDSPYEIFIHMWVTLPTILASTTGAIQQSDHCDRPTPWPLPGCSVPSDAR